MSVFKVLLNRPVGYSESGIFITFSSLLCFQLPGTYETEVVLESKVENPPSNFWDCYKLTN